MITIELNDRVVEDYKLIKELRDMGASEDTIQAAYNNYIKKGDEYENS